MAVCAYIDLNPVAARIAPTPKTIPIVHAASNGRTRQERLARNPPVHWVLHNIWKLILFVFFFWF